MESQSQISLPENSVSGFYSHAWHTLKNNFPELLLVFLLQIVVSLPTGLGSFIFDPYLTGLLFSGLFNLVYSLVVILPVSFGICWVYLKAVRGEPFRPTDIFFSFQQITNVIIAGVLMGFIIGAGIIMLIIPGIIFACKLAFVPYLVMDEKLEATEAIRKSWNMTKGYSGNIFLTGFLAFFIFLLGVLCLLVGVIPASILVSLAFATIYSVASRQ